MVKGEELPNKYSHVIFTLSNRAQLFFNDMRQFGYVKLVDEAGLKEVLSRYGIEPLSPKFVTKELANILSSRKSTIKQVLLNQQAIAGLGNIYVDEACYGAGVRPTRRANQLTVREVNKLRTVIISVLKKSIRARGTTFRNYRDGLGGEGRFVKMLKVYGRAGMPCYRCRALLKKMKTGGRGTVYCAKCQR
jgi:formamidopyrimidine-DNA glycosylase